ncbi:MAG: hypothetical protein NTV49_13560 [Kiritimatiellaeota bacterium]|nr:hypothetical protein [Kiritimatiellota bacterium]
MERANELIQQSKNRELTSTEKGELEKVRGFLRWSYGGFEIDKGQQA